MNEQNNSNIEEKSITTQTPVDNQTPTQNVETQPTTDITTTAPSGEVQKVNKKTVIKNPDAFNSKEQVLFKKEEEKESNPIVVLLIVVFLIGVVVLLPNIYGYFNPDAKGSNGTDDPGIEEPTLIEDKMYSFDGNNLLITVNDLEFSNFVKTEDHGVYDMTFTLINKSPETYQFDKKIYIIFYDGEQEIYNALVHSYQPMGGKMSTQMSVIISPRAYNSGNNFKIKEIKEDAYPSIKLENEKGKYEILNCNYNEDELVFYFDNKLLKKIDEKYSAEQTDNYFYLTNKNNYYQQYLNIKDLNGVDAHFVESATEEDYFDFTASIDLSKIEYSTLSELEIYKYFKYNQTPDIISFELEAQGYTCG